MRRFASCVGVKKVLRCLPSITAAVAIQQVAYQGRGYQFNPRSATPMRASRLDPSIAIEAAEKVLLAQGAFSIFTASIHQDIIAIFCPSRRSVLEVSESDLAQAKAWMSECMDTAHTAMIVYPSHSQDLKLLKFLRSLSDDFKGTLVVGPDAWKMTHDSFAKQRELVSMAAPLGLEHAFHLLTHGRFNPTVPCVVTSADGRSIDGVARVAENSATRCAVLSWDLLLSLHKRFGTIGSKKVQSPVDQIIRCAIRAVNVFVVDINPKVGGQNSDGFTMTVTVYNAQKKNQTTTHFRNVATETEKLNVLSVLFYGEGMSSVTMFVPSPRTKPEQAVALARTCMPKCPFFVAEANCISPFFTNADIVFGPDPPEDPKSVWAAIRTSCFPGNTKKMDEDCDEKLLRAFAALTNYQVEARKAAVASSTYHAALKLPPLDIAKDFANVVDMRSEAPATVADAVMLNQIKVDEGIEKRLQGWLNKVNSNSDRLAREEAAMNSISRYLIIDLETTTKKKYKRVANPFIGENYVVLSGALDYKGTVFMGSEYFPAATALNYSDPAVTAATQIVAGSSPRSLFLPPLDDYDVLVGHNIKFDFHHIWKDAELKAFFKRGGRIWDTMYAEYLLTGHQIKLGTGAGLEDVAKSYGGTTLKLDEVKQAWALGTQTYDIPYATLQEYLHGDLKNTELIFLKHKVRAVHQRQVIIALARMDGLLATTEMEFNGLKTDVPLAIRQSNALVAKVSAHKDSMENFIPQCIPPLLQKHFNWASNQHMIAYFFGGTVKLNTSSRPSKLLPGCSFARHTLFNTSEVPEHLLPCNQAAGPAECAIVAGMSDTMKSTRLYKAYFESYIKSTGFRKSSFLAENLSKKLVATRRNGTDEKVEDAIVNLLPKRAVVIYAAAAKTDGTNELDELVLLSVSSNASLTVRKGEKGRAEKVIEFIEQQVMAYTCKLLPSAENMDPSMRQSAFVEAQVLLVARDAPYTFTQWMMADEEMSTVLVKYGAGIPSEAKKLDTPNQFIVTLVDATSTLCMYVQQYGTVTQEAAKKGITDTSDLVVPFDMVAIETKRKKDSKSNEEQFLKAEALMPPSEWVRKYHVAFAHMAQVAWNKEVAESVDEVVKKAKKGAPTVKAEALRPLLLREHQTVAKALNTAGYLPHEIQTLLLMKLFGRTCGTSHDAFLVASEFAEEVEVAIPGRLSEYVTSSEERKQICEVYRSKETRQLQVGDESLSYFAKTHKDKMADAILDLRQMEKLIGTYYEHTEGGTGMVSLVHTTDSCIHHELQHNKTSTGRLASSNPNCQNIPKEDKSPLREMFVSRFGNEHGMCIEADYSQLEVITLAALADDKQMLIDLANKVDFHCKRVTMIRPDLSYDEVMLRAKKNKEPEFVKMRQQAKVFSFQRQYGAGVKMLSESTGLSREQIENLIKGEKETYKDCEAFSNMVTLSANTFDATLQDGSRNVKGHQIYKGMFPVLTGSRYVFTESDMPAIIMESKPVDFKSTSFSPTHIKNYPVQGFAGEIVQIMLGKLWRFFVANDNYGGKALLTNTVHDCVWVDSQKDIFINVAADVERIMSSAKTELNRLWPEMDYKPEFPVDVVAGTNMGHLRSIPKK